MNFSTLFLFVSPGLRASSAALIIPVEVWWKTKGTVGQGPLRPAVASIYPLAFFQCVITTGLIVFRTLRQHHLSTGAGIRPSHSRYSLLTVTRVIVESAMVYTLELFIATVLYILKHNAQVILQSMVVPTVGKCAVYSQVPMSLPRKQELYLA